MTARIINLRQVRKRRAREAQATDAAENRIRFGRTRAERERDEQNDRRARQSLDGHRREPTPDAGSEDQPADGAPARPAPKSP